MNHYLEFECKWEKVTPGMQKESHSQGLHCCLFLASLYLYTTIQFSDVEGKPRIKWILKCRQSINFAKLHLETVPFLFFYFIKTHHWI